MTAALSITDALQFEKELRNRLETIMDNANDGIFDWDIKNDRLWLSSHFKSMLGYGRDQLINTSIDDWYRLVHADDRNSARLFISECLENNQRPVLTMRFQHRSGAVFYFLCRASVIYDANGDMGSLIGVHTNVTDMIALQQALKSACDKAEASNHAKSDFLANMSHEIRSPMNSIIGMTDLLLGTNLDSQQAFWLNTVRNSSEMLMNIINDIIDFSKIEEGKLNLDPVPFNIRSLIDQIIKSKLVEAQKKRIALRTAYQDSIPEYLIGDPMRLQQILLNLLGNAVKFTESGEVELSVTTQQHKNKHIDLLFEISDTGIGIPPEKILTIFDKFAQADTSTTRKFGGSGLGLTISKKLVEMMGGTIGVRSEPGKGSTFYFTLQFPVASSSHNVKNDASAPKIHHDLSSLHTLIVEDMEPNQIYLHALLRKCGCVADIAKNGKEAVAMARHKLYDLILMDCQMPEMDGFEATKHIRQMSLDVRPVIIGITADVMRSTKEASLNAGMDDYINKPVKADKLTAILAQYSKEKSVGKQ